MGGQDSDAQTVGGPLRCDARDHIQDLPTTDLEAPTLDGIDWVIIGAQTGPGAAPPKREWVENILTAAAYARVPVFVKDNLVRIYPDLGGQNLTKLPYLDAGRP